MKEKDQKTLNNLILRFQNFDTDGVQYYYDIKYITLDMDGEQVKVKRTTGVDAFRSHLNELMDKYSNVSTIIVSDFGGKAHNAKPINPPAVINLMDVVEAQPRVIVQRPETPSAAPQPAVQPQIADALKGLGDVFAPMLDGSGFESLGAIAPVAKMLDDKHIIKRLQEQNAELSYKVTELEGEKRSLQAEYDQLTGKYDLLQDENMDMADELEECQRKIQKNNTITGKISGVLASTAKTFLKNNPRMLSGIIPAEQLAGLFGDDDELEAGTPETSPMEGLSPEQQSQMEDATTIFEWMQNLDNEMFRQVATIFMAMRSNEDYIPHIIKILSKSQPPKTVELE